MRLRDLLKSQGWAQVCRVAEDQLKVRRDSFELTPLKGMDEVLEQEFKKGEVAAIRLFIGLPQTVVDDIEEQLKQHEGEEEDESESDVDES